MKRKPPTRSIAEHYHERTNYSPESIAALGGPDLAERPPVFKEFLSEKTVDLKPFLQGVFLREEDEATGGSPGSVEQQAALGRLSRTLFHTGGITGVLETDEDPQYFRAAPSAGALYPTEIYVVTEGFEGLADGIHFYSVRQHALVPAWEGTFKAEFQRYCLGSPALEKARMWIVFSGFYRRSSWRYHERAYRRILLDTGHVLGNLIAYAPLEGLVATPLGSFVDAAINDLFFFDPQEEVALLVVPLIERKPASSVILEHPYPLPSSREGRTDLSPGDGIMRLLHRYSEIEPAGSNRHEAPCEAAMRPECLAREDISGPVVIRSCGESGIDDLPQVIRRRRSTRRFHRGHVSLEELSGVLRYGFDSTDVYFDPRDPVPLGAARFLDPSMQTTYVVALRVDGLPPGVYRLDEDGPSFHLRREGNFEAEVWHICLDQQLGRDCAAAVFHTADLATAVERYGNRAYRYIHLDAGHIGQRLNLAAIGAGLGVSGIGGFFDEDVNELLELPEDGITAYITLLGPVWQS